MEKANPQDILNRTFQFSLQIIRLVRSLDKGSSEGKVLGRQLLRSATSIGANIEEAQAGQSKADFINKSSIALKEARETIYWLRLLKASEINGSANFSDALLEAGHVARILGAIVVTSKKGKVKRAK